MNQGIQQSSFDKFHSLPLDIIETLQCLMLKYNPDSAQVSQCFKKVANKIEENDQEAFEKLWRDLKAVVNSFLKEYADTINKVASTNDDIKTRLVMLAGVGLDRKLGIAACKMIPLFMNDYSNQFSKFFDERKIIEGNSFVIKLVTLPDSNIIDDTYLIINAQNGLGNKSNATIDRNDCFVSFTQHVSQFHMKLNINAKIKQDSQSQQDSQVPIIELTWNQSEQQKKDLYTFLKIMYGYDVFQDGGAKKQTDKVYVLGRWRTVQKVGRKKMIKYKGELIPLSEAKRMK